MNDVLLLRHQIGYEQKAFWRNPASAFFTFVFPLMFLVIFASLNKGAKIKEMGNISFNQYYIPAIITFGLISAAFTSLAMVLTLRRDAGLLKRVRGTPLPTWAMFGGLLGSIVVVCLISTVVTIVAGITLYDVHAPYHVLPLIVAIVLGVATFCALGVAVSSFIPNAESAPAIINLPYIGLLFISGIWFPLPDGSFLKRLGDFFPVAHLKDAIFAAFDPRVHGSGFSGHSLLVLAIWAVAGGIVAVRRFRWESKATP